MAMQSTSPAPCPTRSSLLQTCRAAAEAPFTEPRKGATSIERESNYTSHAGLVKKVSPPCHTYLYVQYRKRPAEQSGQKRGHRIVRQAIRQSRSPSFGKAIRWGQDRGSGRGAMGLVAYGALG